MVHWKSLTSFFFFLSYNCRSPFFSTPSLADEAVKGGQEVSPHCRDHDRVAARTSARRSGQKSDPEEAMAESAGELASVSARVGLDRSV
jgi:hypothetical protein